MFVAIALLMICALASGCKPNETTISRNRCDPVCYSAKQLCAPKDSPQKCFCKRGYKRLAHDFAAPCVLPKGCIKCGKNQEYKMCGSACPEYCGKPAGTECGCPPNQTTISRTRCDPVCYSSKRLCAPKDSPQKCFCKRGYKRLAHDFAAPCVLPKDCIKCGKNQEYKMCGSACPEYCGKPAGTESCGPHETKFRIKRCDRVCNSDKQLCAPKDSKQKCFCKLGFQRLTNDFAAACVRSKDCVKCDENQEYKVCGPLCPEHCGKPDDTKCEEKCVKGCFSICGPNQEYNMCVDVCPLTCDNYENPPECSFGKVCLPGCKCKKGYVRLNDACVPIAECPNNRWPILCAANRTYQYRGIHVKTCDNVDLYPSDPGCYCRKGYFLDRTTGECVLRVKCPNEYNCFENEELSDCRPAWLPTCAFPHLGPCYPIIPTLCEKGCVCKKGFVWDSDSGSCVKLQKCSVVCGPNQEYDMCLDVCPLTCENYQNPPHCSPGIVCNEGCKCKEGYVLLNGVCVPIKECPSNLWPIPCTMNSTFQYKGIHVKTCDNVDLYPSDPGCYCRKGYFWDRNSGTCVLKVDCPIEYNCFDNEELSDCKPTWQPTCALPHLRTCFPIAPTVCEKACVCKDGYVWDSESGFCVVPRKCSGLLCPLNEEWSSCVPPCTPTCNNPIPSICPYQLCKEGCECKPGFIRETENGGCVLPTDCPSKKCSGPHEIYRDCGSSCPLTCGEPLRPCPKICVQGCFCQEGFLRAHKGGKCIPLSQCKTYEV
ncbi:riddle [Holotrichia oblita]|uniref:Riddle n=1 Tax=Holotrichia oblita TaxID=644536 RepID=A0ACB9T9I7_HOLOL|nr:riddle [Holotrichia oblita]